MLTGNHHLQPKDVQRVSVAEAARLLDVSQSFIRKALNTGELPANRLAARVTRIKLTDLERWAGRHEYHDTIVD